MTGFELENSGHDLVIETAAWWGRDRGQLFRFAHDDRFSVSVIRDQVTVRESEDNVSIEGSRAQLRLWAELCSTWQANRVTLAGIAGDGIVKYHGLPLVYAPPRRPPERVDERDPLFNEVRGRLRTLKAIDPVEPNIGTFGVLRAFVHVPTGDQYARYVRGDACWGLLLRGRLVISEHELASDADIIEVLESIRCGFGARRDFPAGGATVVNPGTATIVETAARGMAAN